MRILLPAGNQIQIDDVVISDPVASTLLDRHPIAEMDQRLALFADMVEIGARVIQQQQDGQQGFQLRRELDDMRQSLLEVQDSLVATTANSFATGVQSILSEVSTSLASIGGRLDGALAVASKDRDLAEERERGTAKGRPFEQAVFEDLVHIARVLGDLADHTGDSSSLGGRAGDVVVEVGAAQGQPKGRIVFEAKTGRLSKPESMRELDRAIETRGADFGVLVVGDRSKLPANTWDLREYGGNKIIVALDDAADGSWLELAYSLARARVLQRYAASSSTSVDADGARNCVEMALQVLDDQRKVKLRTTAIAKEAQATQEIVDDMIDRVRVILARANEALS